jgi:hypothetical protein
MKDRNGIIIATCFIVELLLGVLVFTSFTWLGWALIPVISIAWLIWIFGLVISLIEVVGSVKIGNLEKVLWVIGLVSLFNLVCIVYLILRRSRILSLAPVTTPV